MEGPSYTLEDFKTLLWQRDQTIIQLNRAVQSLQQEVITVRSELAKKEQESPKV